MIKKLFLVIVVAMILASCSFRHAVRVGYYPYPVMRSVEPGYTQVGIASWYGPDFHGKRTADGEIYNMYAHTAASRTLPFNTMVRVINLNNGRSTIVRINDRGPFIKNRIIDLSYAAARDIGMIGTGTAPVKVVVIGSKGFTYTTNTIKQPSMEELEHIDINTNIGGDFDKDEGTHLVAVRFAIQFGAFSNLYNALRLRDKLSHYFRGVYIEKKRVNGEIFYRVLLGSFSSEERAVSYAKRYVVPVTTTFIISKK